MVCTLGGTFETVASEGILVYVLSLMFCLLMFVVNKKSCFFLLKKYILLRLFDLKGKLF